MHTGIRYRGAMDLGLQGRRAAVAAGSSGLGLGVARALAAEGARVMICGRDADRLAAAAATVPGGCETFVADLADDAQATGFAEEATRTLGGVDILVLNAGGPPAGGFADTDLDSYRDAIELNLLSAVALCQVAVPPMRARGWGRVLAITSSTVREPTSGLILSNVARAGVTAFAKTLAGDVARDGVTVNTLQPGLHDTPRLGQLGTPADTLTASIPMGRLGNPDDFGRVAAFLCSDSAGYITGVSIPVDGGAFSGLQ